MYVIKSYHSVLTCVWYGVERRRLIPSREHKLVSNWLAPTPDQTVWLGESPFAWKPKEKGYPKNIKQWIKCEHNIIFATLTHTHTHYLFTNLEQSRGNWIGTLIWCRQCFNPLGEIVADGQDETTAILRSWRYWPYEVYSNHIPRLRCCNWVKLGCSCSQFPIHPLTHITRSNLQQPKEWYACNTSAYSYMY